MSSRAARRAEELRRRTVVPGVAYLLDEYGNMIEMRQLANGEVRPGGIRPASFRERLRFLRPKRLPVVPKP